MAKGRKTGGRTAGTPNRDTQDVTAKLAALGCDPIAGLAAIATGNEVCRVCLGTKKIKYRRRDDGELVFDPEGKLMDCLHCYGSGNELIPVAQLLKARAELAGYVAPKRKAIELTQGERKGDFTLAELLATMRRNGE